MKRYLVLEDGTTYCGTAFGADVETVGEIAFSTGMSGYQELISDPASNGTILNFTAPIIGNSGINKKFDEADTVVAHGVLVNQLAGAIGNYQSEMSLDEYLTVKGVPGIADIDTRSIMLKLREKGVMRAAIVNEADAEKVKEIADFDPDIEQLSKSWNPEVRKFGEGEKHVVIIDCGVGYSLIRVLNKQELKVTVVPRDYSIAQIQELQPDAIILSDGPGKPTLYEKVIENVKELQVIYPLLGIGLGHQILGLANGAEIQKMKVGQHGFNYMVKDLKTDKNYFTAQNHHFAIDRESLEGTDLELTQEGLHDGVVQGLKHKKHQAYSVQFHPEGRPGPNDANFILNEFIERI